MGRGRKPRMDAVAREARVLGDEFCSLVNASPEEALRKMLEQLPLDRVNLQERQKGDPDLSDLKERMKTASAPYREGFKRIDMKSARIRRRLQEMGKPVGDDSEQEGRTLPPESFDKLGGKKSDALAGIPTEPRETEKAKASKKTAEALKSFEQKIASAPKVEEKAPPAPQTKLAN